MSYEGMKCFECGELFAGKANAKYCSAKCRVKANRNKTDSLSVTDVTDTLSVTDLELCRTCQGLLPPLEKPRQYPGKCLRCEQEVA